MGDTRTPAQRRDDALRAVIRAITATDHQGVQRRTAEALGLPPSTLNGYMSARESNTVLPDRVAAYLNRTVDEIVTARGNLEELRRARRSTSRGVCFGELPSWPALLSGAKVLAPDIPAWCWRDLAETVVWVSVPVTSAMARDCALFLLEHTPPHG